MTAHIPTAGLIGVVCGDVMGLPYEFRGTRTKDYHFELKLRDFSDDTILTVAIARWLMGERTREALRQYLLEYAQRFKDKNVWGRGFMAWVESGGTLDRKGVASNGAAMRVTPIGYASDDLQEVLRLAELSARVTHDSDEAARGAQAVAAAVFLARTGHSKAEVRSYTEQTFGYDLSRTVDDIRKDYQFEILCDRCVPESIICWLQSDTYEETVRNAVSLGGDADTMAAIAGGIAAATPGMEVPAALAEPCFHLLPDDFVRIIWQFENFVVSLQSKS
jgi:ADP-ribosylglycohydrolase